MYFYLNKKIKLFIQKLIQKTYKLNEKMKYLELFYAFFNQNKL